MILLVTLEVQVVSRVCTDPKILHGKPHIRGTRIPVFVILQSLAEGMTAEEIVTEYPPLAQKDIRAAIQYAARLTEEETGTLKPSA